MRTHEEQSVQQDLHRLAGSFPHRGSNTESERNAAGYILSRFRDLTHDSGFEEFHSIDSFFILFAGYYSEFFIVCLIAIWVPWVAAIYGTFVFLAYLAEFTGYRVLTRLLPQYESQNVVARFLAPRPRRLYVITAHYDAGKGAALFHPVFVRWLPWLHRLLVLCMVACIVGAMAQGANLFEGSAIPVAVIVQWTAATILMAAGLGLLFCEAGATYVRGAMDNASGTAALLLLAEQVSRDPLEEADVWCVATGSKEGWMNGIRHLVTSHDFDPGTTYFINLDYLGAPCVRYVVAEGMLHRFSCDASLVDAARSLAPKYGAEPFVHRGLPTDLLIPLTRGCKAIGVTTTEEDGTQPLRQSPKDTLAAVDPAAVVRAVRFVEQTLRHHDAELTARERPHAPSELLR